MTTPRTSRLIPLIFPLLALLGVVLTVLFALESTPTAAVDLTVGRDQAGQIGAEYVRTQGDDPDARWTTTSYQFDGNVHSYLLQYAGRTTLADRAAQDLDLAHWRVRLFNPLNPDQWNVYISSRTGRVIGFDHAIRDEQAGATLPITQAQQLALAALPVPADQVTLVARSSNTQPDRVDHTFVWEQPNLAAAEARYRYTVRVQGDRVGAVDEYYFLPDSWWRETEWQGRRGALLSTVGWTITYLLTALIGLTWLIEARRGRLRWRWAATLFVAVLITGLLVALNSIPLDLANYDVNQSIGSYVTDEIGSYMLQLLNIAVTIVLAGMAGEALVWQRSGGRLHLGRMLTSRGIVSRPVVQALLIGGLVGVFQIGFISAFYALGGRWFGVSSPVTALYDDTLSTPFPALYALALGLLPAVGEELLFRLGGIEVLTRWTGKRWFAVVFTAIVWASLHATYEQRPFFIRVLELSIIGVIFGILYVRYGVLTSMAAHYTYNASLYVPLFWGGSVVWLLSGVLIAGAVLLLLLPALLRRLRGRPLESAVVLAEPLPPPLAEHPPLRVPYRRRRTWRWLLIAAGFASVALIGVGWNLPPTMRRSTTDVAAINATRQIASQLNVDLAGLNPAALPQNDWIDIDLRYLHDTQSRATSAAVVQQDGHERAWRVRWSAWDRPDSWVAELDPRNGLLTFERTLPEDAPGATIPVTAALDLATAAFRSYANVDLTQYELIDSATAQRTNRTDHAFTWQTRQPIVDDAHRRVVVGVQGDQVSSISALLYTPPEYRRQREQTTLGRSLREGISIWMAQVTTLGLVVIGLLGVLRRRTLIAPWAWLGVAGGAVQMVLALLRLTDAQLAEAPRLMLGISWAVADAALNGSQLALLAAGTATAWSWSYGRFPALHDQAMTLLRGGSLRRDGMGYGWLVLPLGLLWSNALRWPAAEPGIFSGVGTLASVLPAIDGLGRALLGATTATLLLVGAAGLIEWLLGGYRWIALALTVQGALLASIDLTNSTHLLVTLLAWPIATWLAWHLRGNVLGLWFGLLLLRLVPTALALVQSGPLWYAINGWALFTLLVLLALWTLWASRHGLQLAQPIPPEHSRTTR